MFLTSCCGIINRIEIANISRAKPCQFLFWKSILPVSDLFRLYTIPERLNLLQKQCLPRGGGGSWDGWQRWRRFISIYIIYFLVFAFAFWFTKPRMIDHIYNGNTTTKVIVVLSQGWLEKSAKMREDAQNRICEIKKEISI